MVEVVQDGDERAARLVEVGAEVEHLHLVGDVEERRRLVEQQQRRLLGERHREPGALALAAGELVDEPVREVGSVRVWRSASVTARSSSRDHWRRSFWCGWRPRANEVDDGDPVGRGRALGQQPEPARDLLGRQRADQLAVEQHRTRHGA